MIPDPACLRQRGGASTLKIQTEEVANVMTCLSVGMATCTVPYIAPDGPGGCRGHLVPNAGAAGVHVNPFTKKNKNAESGKTMQL